MPNLNVSLKQLKVFLAVVDTHHFSRAGELVGLSQPAVSRAIHELEQQLDLKLFVRTTREVVLTEAGQLLAQRLPRWMDELDNTLLELQHWASSRRGKVRVASAPTLSAALMPLCLAESARREPGLDVLLLDRVQQDVLQSVLAGEVDFGVVVEPGGTILRDLHCQPILKDPFVVVAPPRHPVWRGNPPARMPAWQRLSDYPLILLDYASGSRRLIDSAFGEHAIAPRIVQQVGHATTGFEMVRMGLGISVMPGLAIPETGVPGLLARPLSPAVERSIVLTHRRNRPTSPLALCLWHLIQDCALSIQSRRELLWQAPAS